MLYGHLSILRQGSLRLLAAITQAAVIRKILRHLKLAADPPLIAPARARQQRAMGSLKWPRGRRAYSAEVFPYL